MNHPETLYLAEQSRRRAEMDAASAYHLQQQALPLRRFSLRAYLGQALYRFGQRLQELGCQVGGVSPCAGASERLV